MDYGFIRICICILLLINLLGTIVVAADEEPLALDLGRLRSYPGQQNIIRVVPNVLASEEKPIEPDVEYGNNDGVLGITGQNVVVVPPNCVPGKELDASGTCREVWNASG